MYLRTCLLIFLSSWFVCSELLAQQNQSYLDYIEQYHKLAQKQQQEYGIPSSITLAQGLLESSAGKSFLSTSSNNHFGIKCTDWKGETMYYDDDEKGECFRKYKQVIDSYEDHSKFLSTRPRYASLFKLAKTDYEGWAFGLKSAGYATDPTYAFKLISLIENYNLKRFDSETNVLSSTRDGDAATEAKPTNEYIGKVSTYVPHELKRVNGVLLVTSVSGDSYASIGDEFDLTDERIRRYNDVSSTEELSAGQRVFVAEKKHKAPKDILSHKVQAGESLWSISQDYGIRVVDLYYLNNLSFEQSVTYGQVLKLR